VDPLVQTFDGDRRHGDGVWGEAVAEDVES
jgi:hypothetical protein